MATSPRSEAALTTLEDFANGTTPVAGLVQAQDGLLYGTTESGGANNTGMVYQVTLDGTVTLIHSFTGGNGGASPDAELVVAKDGSMYGTTIRGGNQQNGVIYRITTNGDFNVVHSVVAGTE